MKVKKFIKVLFRYLRAADRRITRLLDVSTNFRATPFKGTEDEEGIDLDQIAQYDAKQFMRYSKNPKASILFRLYRGTRNRVFVRSYRAFRRFVR